MACPGCPALPVSCSSLNFTCAGDIQWLSSAQLHAWLVHCLSCENRGEVALLPATLRPRFSSECRVRCSRRNHSGIPTDFVPTRQFVNSEHVGKVIEQKRQTYEDESLRWLPARHHISTLLDMHVRQPNSRTVTKAEETQLVLALKVPSGSRSWKDVTSGETREGARMGRGLPRDWRLRGSLGTAVRTLHGRGWGGCST